MNKKDRIKSVVFNIALLIIVVVIFIVSRKSIVEDEIRKLDSIGFPAKSSQVYVHDYSFGFSDETERYIEELGKSLTDSTSAQVVLVMMEDTGEVGIETYANKLANKWGIGSAEENNGVLILFTREPHVRIEVGKGLEGRLNDSKAGRILDDYAVEDMKAGNFNKAAINTYVAVVREVCKEYGIDFPYDERFATEEPPMDRSISRADAKMRMRIITLTEDERDTEISSIKASSTILAFTLSFILWIFIIILKVSSDYVESCSYSYEAKSKSGFGSDRGGFSGFGGTSGGGFGGGGFGGGGASR